MKKNLINRVLALAGALAVCTSVFALNPWIDESKVSYMEMDGCRFLVEDYIYDPITLEFHGLTSTDSIKDRVFTIPQTKCIEGYEYSYDGGKRDAIVTAIGSYAFYNDFPTTSLSPYHTIKLPSTVITVCDYAFAWCRVNIIELNEGIQYIGRFAFMGSGMESIKIPESVKTMGPGVFKGCRYLKKVDFPSGITCLYPGTFELCKSMEQIICRATVPPTADYSSFGMEYLGNAVLEEGPYSVDRDCKIYVPRESIELYRNAPGWDRFINFLAIEDMTDDVEIPMAEAQGIEYTVESGTVTVSCQSGDVVQIFDASGVCLDRKAFESAGRYTYSGSGVCIVHLNGRSVKVIL